MARWQDRLTAKERAHLRENKIRTLKRLREARRVQLAGKMPATVGSLESCWDCRMIAKKLGVEQ